MDVLTLFSRPASAFAQWGYDNRTGLFPSAPEHKLSACVSAREWRELSLGRRQENSPIVLYNWKTSGRDGERS
jgi:hypothetical protein